MVERTCGSESEFECLISDIEEENEETATATAADHYNQTAGYREKCRNMLRNSSSSSEETPTYASHTHCGHSARVSVARTDAVHQNLYRYGDAELELQCWMDLDAVKGLLLIEIKAWSRTPVLSEKNASQVLVSWSAAELPRRLADRATDSLKSADLDSVYRRWRSMVACEQADVGTGVSYRVTLERGKRYPHRRVRPWWALPLLLVAEETRYALPLLDCFKRGDGAQCIYFTLERDQKCVLQLQPNKKCFDAFERCYATNFQYMIINYAVFDSVVPNWVVRLCFDVLMQKLNFGHEKQAGGTTKTATKEVDETANRTRYKMMVEHLLRMPIDVSCAGDTIANYEDDDDDGEEYTVLKRRGIPGGSCFTHLVRTMSNFLITWIVADLVFHEKAYSYRFHGSKCVLVFESKCKASLCAFSQCAQTYFGVVVDRNRSCFTAAVEDFHSLKYCCETDEDD